MRARLSQSLAAFAVLSTTACGYGLHETAKTVAPGSTTLTVGIARQSNELDGDRSKGTLNELAKVAVDLGPARFGLTEHMDIGFRELYIAGGAVDVKYNLLPRDAKLAVAPRLGLGAASFFENNGVIVPSAGVIGSFDVLPELTPYLAATFANHFFIGTKPGGTLPEGQSYAARAGYGDGVLQLVGGVMWHVGSVVSLSAEYGRWQPMQNDPGDGRKLLVNDIVSVAIHFCLQPPCT